MSDAADMNRFLAGVERKAYRMAQAAVGDSEDALDIVQDTMLALVRRYADKPADEWRPLFYRILQSRITDAHRRRSVRRRVFAWFTEGANDEGLDPIETAPDLATPAPDVRLTLDTASEALSAAVEQLPLRQQQAFLLRSVEGFSVEETATAMGCSDGSVKTHYSRAVHALRGQLEDYRP